MSDGPLTLGDLAAMPVTRLKGVGGRKAEGLATLGVENLFDLCRDYSILTQSPHAGPCPWKQMNKCVGPCDGSVSLEAYRELIAFSTKVLIDPEDFIREQQRRMKAAAGELRFQVVTPPEEAEDWATRILDVVEEVAHEPMLEDRFEARMRRYRGERLDALAEAGLESHVSLRGRRGPRSRRRAVGTRR